MKKSEIQVKNSWFLVGEVTFVSSLNILGTDDHLAVNDG